MRAMLLVGAVMTLSAFGVAYAGEGEGVVPNTLFTRLPGAVAEAPAQVNSSATMVAGAPSTQSYVTHSRQGTWVFPPNATGGGANS